MIIAIKAVYDGTVEFHIQLSLRTLSFNLVSYCGCEKALNTRKCRLELQL